MKRPSLHTVALLAILGLAFTLFLLPLPHGWSAGWRGELVNRMHAPLMGIWTVVLASLLRRYLWPMPSLLLAAPGAALMAAVIEWVQPWFGRTASVDDFLWGMAGVLGGCIWLVAGLTQTKVTTRVAGRMLAMVCAVAPPLLWWTQISLIQAEARRLFPTLAESSHSRMHPLWTVEPRQKGRHDLLLIRDASHPGSMHLDTLDRDWSGYAGLEISGTLQAAAAVEVGVRLDLGEEGGTRLRAGGWMQPGSSVIQIDWPKNAPTPKVHQLVVFLAADPVAARLDIQRLRLIEIPATQKAGTKKVPSAGLQDAGIAQ